MCKSLWARHTSGAALPATLLLVAAASLTALAAVRSATTETRLTSTLMAADVAFALAEQGIAAGLEIARTNPGLLSASNPLVLPSQTMAGLGSVSILIQPGATDNICPALSPLAAIRQHFEIRATGIADLSVRTTHVQGFYICREICAAAGCVALELAPVASYWRYRAGTAQ